MEYPKPQFQSEAKCKTFDMKTIFYSYANKSHFHKKCFALSLVLKVRAFETRKWPVFAAQTKKSLAVARKQNNIIPST